ncbi:hypothetical protein BTHER_09112 [Brochothrix thermosphacta DSM 20171 = FSL F6-1036]|nr:hypothetical protein BTHER_09112 [Brochothrix thermosphacta DSM 20171 = FSL F6-1036]
MEWYSRKADKFATIVAIFFVADRLFFTFNFFSLAKTKQLLLNFKKLFLTKSVKKSFYCSLTTTANGLLSFKKISRHREPPSFFSKLVAIVWAVFVFIGAKRLVFTFIYSPVKKAKTCEISKILF